MIYFSGNSIGKFFPLDLEYSFLLKLLPLARKGTTGSYTVFPYVYVYTICMCASMNICQLQHLIYAIHCTS